MTSAAGLARLLRFSLHASQLFLPRAIGAGLFLLAAPGIQR